MATTNPRHHCLVGLGFYFFGNAKAVDLGRILFFCGMLVITFAMGGVRL